MHEKSKHAFNYLITKSNIIKKINNLKKARNRAWAISFGR
jgi:hypothetical protein